MELIVFPILISIGLLYTLISAVVTSRAAKSLASGNDLHHHPGISVLKPLKGIDDQLEMNLESFFRQDYPVYELLFGVNDPEDPAIGIVRKLQQRYPNTDAKLIISTNRIGLNPKINNLNNIYPHSEFEYILISDSNVRAPANYLTDMAAAIQNPDVGLVISIFRGVGARSVGAILENLHLNTFILSSVYTVKKLFNIPITIGKSMLFRKNFLKRFDAFYGLRDFLAEDHLLGIQVQEAGLQVVYSSVHIDNYNENWSLDRFINRHVRWAKMRKNLNLTHYLAEPFANPVLIATTGLLIARTVEMAAVATAALLIKMSIDIFIDRQVRSDLRWHQYALLPFKDILMGMIWFIPFFNNRINWRGNEFKITRGTRLVNAT
jgi:ceramide glucosyltransferase